jgi:membrane protein CcdC involved in cytochrome C biogenesis
MRPLKLETLWVVPALYLGVAALMFWSLPPTGWVAIASAAALLIGSAVGWQRGKMMQIHVDPETHALNQKASPAAMFFLIALIIVRSGARAVLGNGSGVSPAMLTDPLIAFALGMFTLTRIEMYLRAKRLLGKAGAEG